MNTTDYSSRWHVLSARGCVPAHICKQCSMSACGPGKAVPAQWPCERLQEPFRWKASNRSAIRARGPITRRAGETFSWLSPADCSVGGCGELHRRHAHTSVRPCPKSKRSRPSPRAWHACLSKVLSDDHHDTCKRNCTADEFLECLHDVLPVLFRRNIDGAALAIARGLAIFMRRIGKPGARRTLVYSAFVRN